MALTTAVVGGLLGISACCVYLGRKRWRKLRAEAQQQEDNEQSCGASQHETPSSDTIARHKEERAQGPAELVRQGLPAELVRQGLPAELARQGATDGDGKDAMIAAITSTLTLEGIDILRWEQIKLEDLYHTGTVSKHYVCSSQSHFGDTKLLLRRMHKEALSVSGAAEIVAQQSLFKKLNHSHIMPILGVVSDGAHSIGFLEERMPRTLATVLKSAESSDRTTNLVRQVHMHIMADIASGLRYLHGEKIGHFSLHPENVLLTADMQAKLTDYGRSPRILNLVMCKKDLANKSSSGVRPNENLDHVSYLPPELVVLFPSQSANADEHTYMSTNASIWCAAIDAWALGCLLVRMVTMRPLYADAEIPIHDPNPAAHLLSSIALGELSPTDGIAESASVRADVIAFVRK